MPEVKLSSATIPYTESGDGPPVVFVHGALVDGRLWRKVTPLLSDRARCVVPDLPLGAHKHPTGGADLTPPALARMVAEFLTELDLRDVTLVGNDTGGLIAQLVATRHGDRVGRLVLTPCDSHENFLPKLFKPLEWGARVPPLLFAAVQPLRFRRVRRLPIAFGWLAKRPIDPEVEGDWVRAFFGDAGVRRDTYALLRGVDDRYSKQAAKDLETWGKPLLLAWAVEDKVFPFSYAERFARDVPGARLERIEDSYTFVSEDNPQRTAELIGDFLPAA